MISDIITYKTARNFIINSKNPILGIDVFKVISIGIVNIKIVDFSESFSSELIKNKTWSDLLIETKKSGLLLLDKIQQENFNVELMFELVFFEKKDIIRKNKKSVVTWLNVKNKKSKT